MGDLKLSGAAPVFSEKQVQPPTVKDKSSLPPAELSKQKAPEAGLSPKDQVCVPPNKIEGGSKTHESFIDQPSQPAEGLPSKAEFVWLLSQQSASNQAYTSGKVLTADERKSLDSDSLKAQQLREKIKSAINQEPPSAEAKEMLWVLNQHSKTLQGYQQNAKEYEAYNSVLKQLYQK